MQGLKGFMMIMAVATQIHNKLGMAAHMLNTKPKSKKERLRVNAHACCQRNPQQVEISQVPVEATPRFLCK